MAPSRDRSDSEANHEGLRSGAVRLATLDTGDLFASTSVERTAVAPAPFGTSRQFVGRDNELRRLRELLAQAHASRTARVLVLTGPAGTGKTRLARELAAAAAQEHRWQIWSVSARDAASGYAPVSQWLAHWCGLHREQPPEVNHERIMFACQKVLPPHLVTESAHLLGHLLDLPFPHSAVVGPLLDNPQTLQSRLFLTIRRLLATISEQTPLLLIGDHLEDLDGESLRLLRYVTAGLAQRPVAMVLASRDSRALERELAAEAQTTRFSLGPLEKADVAALLMELCRGAPALPGRMLTMAEALGGTPRAVADLVRYLAEAGVLRRGAENVEFDEAAFARLPDITAGDDSLRQLTAARIALLDQDTKTVLQRASVLGAIAWVDALVALGRAGTFSPDTPDGPALSEIATGPDDAALGTLKALDRLSDGEWLVASNRSTIRGERAVLFLHPDLQEAVYETIEPTLRAGYHEMAAQWLELSPAARENNLHADIARHWLRAERYLDAALAFRRAADTARAQFANAQAIDFYLRALRHLRHRDLSTRIHLWHDLGGVYERVGDLDAALGAFERMLRLAWVGASKVKAAVAFNRMGRIWRSRAEIELAHAYLDRASHLFREAGDQRGIATSLDDLGRLLHLQGRFAEAELHLREAFGIRERLGDARSVAASLAALGALAEDRGDIAAAYRSHSQALELQRKSADRLGALQSQVALAALSTLRGDAMDARAGWQRALADARELGVVSVISRALLGLGELHLTAGQLDDARRHLSEAYAIAGDLDEVELQAECRRALAELERRAGNLEAAREHADAALRAAESGQIRHLQGKAQLTLAMVLSSSLYDPDKTELGLTPHGSPATAAFMMAIALWRELGNAPELAHALLEYGRHCLEAGELEKGREALTEALALQTQRQLPQRADTEQLLQALPTFVALAPRS